MRGEQMETAKTIDVNTKYFSNISHRERAIFEGGISMGALFHQFIGTPVSIKSAETLEKSMEQSLELQPCINSVTVKINNEKLEELNTEFDYVSLSGDMLDVTIISEFEGTLAKVRMQYQEDLKYPLMYIEQITD
jgi:hypothetical protein